MNIASDVLNMETLHQEDGIYRLKSKSESQGVFLPQTHDRLNSLEDSSWWFKFRNRVIEAGIKRTLSENFIADCGGGNGFVASYLESCGYETILFEPGEAGIRNAKSRGLRNLVNAPLDRNTVLPASLPAVGLFDVLEHIEFEGKFLRDLRYALKPGGMLYVTVPAHQFLWSAGDQRHHFRRYNIKGLRKVIVDNGFEVVFDTYFFRMLSLPIFVFRSLPYRIFVFKKNTPKQREGVSIKKSNRSHLVVPGFVEKIVHFCFDREVRKLRKGRMCHGSSIFLAARKI